MFDVGVGCMAKIPGCRTEQEMREFWDTHDSAEYFEDMKDDGVQITFKQEGAGSGRGLCGVCRGRWRLKKASVQTSF